MRTIVVGLVIAAACGAKAPPPASTPVAENHATPAEPERAAPPPPADPSDQRVQAIHEVDAANPRSVDKAVHAADALGEAKAPGGVEALIALANKPPDAHLIA